MSEYYTTRNGKSKRGPYSGQQLKQLAASGELQPTDLIWKQGFPKWVPATQVKGLFVFGLPPAQAPNDNPFAELGRDELQSPHPPSEGGADDNVEVCCERCGTVNLFSASDKPELGECCHCGTSFMVPSRKQFKYAVEEALEEEKANQKYQKYVNYAVFLFLGLVVSWVAWKQFLVPHSDKEGAVRAAKTIISSRTRAPKWISATVLDQQHPHYVVHVVWVEGGSIEGGLVCVELRGGDLFKYNDLTCFQPCDDPPTPAKLAKFKAENGWPTKK